MSARRNQGTDALIRRIHATAQGLEGDAPGRPGEDAPPSLEALQGFPRLAALLNGIQATVPEPGLAAPAHRSSCGASWSTASGWGWAR